MDLAKITFWTNQDDPRPKRWEHWRTVWRMALEHIVKDDTLHTHNEKGVPLPNQPPWQCCPNQRSTSTAPHKICAETVAHIGRLSIVHCRVFSPVCVPCNGAAPLQWGSATFFP